MVVYLYRATPEYEEVLRRKSEKKCRIKVIKAGRLWTHIQ